MSDYQPGPDTCYSHMRDEPWDPDHDYRVCGECFHVFPTGAALLADFNEMLDQTGSDSAGHVIDPEQVYSCPHCAHDF